jgi:hypothetical protein
VREAPDGPKYDERSVVAALRRTRSPRLQLPVGLEYPTIPGYCQPVPPTVRPILSWSNTVQPITPGGELNTDRALTWRGETIAKRGRSPAEGPGPENPEVFFVADRAVLLGALSEEQSNLAMARYKLMQIERALAD